MKIGTVEPQKLRGLADKAFGLYKEFIGTVLNNDRLTQEGEAQQEKATEELKAFRKQLEAEKADKKAKTAEQRQRTAQRTKETASA